MWVASVIHLTDMHLYLAADGGVRRPVDREAHIEFLLRQAYRFDSVGWRTLFVGISEHNRRALRMLKARLPEVISDERGDALRTHGLSAGSRLPIIVVQTGDVEAYGAREVAGGGYVFPGWDHLRSDIAPLLDQADDGHEHAWIDIFGNHDVWAGAVPFTRPSAHSKVMEEAIACVPHLDGPWPERCVHAPVLAGGRILEVYRASTVPEGWLASVRAKGKLTPHPLGQLLPLTGSDNALDELIAVAEATYDERSIRLLLLHHPVHAFAADWRKRTGTAAFADRDRLARIIGRVPFQLVIAGHRHALDPAEGVSYDAQSTMQRPLPRGTGQLVAESPTLERVVFDNVIPPEPTANSFSVYRLLVDEEHGVFSVRRTVFRYRDSASEPFRASEPETVLSNLALE
jgi:hypothetical protein